MRFGICAISSAAPPELYRELSVLLIIGDWEIRLVPVIITRGQPIPPPLRAVQPVLQWWCSCTTAGSSAQRRDTQRRAHTSTAQESQLRRCLMSFMFVMNSFTSTVGGLKRRCTDFGYKTHSSFGPTGFLPGGDVVLLYLTFCECCISPPLHPIKIAL